MFKYLLFLSLIIFAKVFAANNILANFESGIAQLEHFYNYKTGLWQDDHDPQGFWYWANAHRLLANYQSLTGDKQYSSLMYNTLKKNKTKVIKNIYFDDKGWWALAFISAYQTTNNINYLNASKEIVNDISARGLQHVCGDGGVYWDVKKTQVGSIANELYIQVNAKLYMITQEKKYKDIANNTWEWFKKSGLISSNFVVVDHYKIQDGKCGEKVHWHFTYTNGILLGVLADLATINKNVALMDHAKAVARRVMYEYSLGGILTEPCSNVSACADDAFLFKGMFVHELSSLAVLTKDQEFINEVSRFLNNNYARLVANQGTSELYAFSWSLPIDFDKGSTLYNPSDVVTQLSALYLMSSVLKVNKQAKNIKRKW